MASDAGSSVARRRRRLSTVFQHSDLLLCFILFFHKALVYLGYVISSAVAICERCVQYRFYIFWLLCSPSPSLMAAIVPDLCQNTCTPPQVCVSQISDLKLTRQAPPSLSPKTMTFLPPGKIDSTWFWCKRGSCNSPLCSLLARSMSLNGSQNYYQTIQARNLLFDEPPTNRCSLQTPFVATLTIDCSPCLTVSDLNDQRLRFCSVKPLLLQHGNAGVGRLWLDSKLVPSEIGVNPISVSAGTKVSSSLKTDLSQRKFCSTLLGCERDIICGSLISDCARMEYSRFSVHDEQFIQALKYPFVVSQNSLIPPSTYFLCFRGQLLESSKDCQSVSVNSYWHVLPTSIRRPKLSNLISRQCLVSFPNLPKLKTNSLLTLSCVDKFLQTSSRQGRERSLSTSSFSKERIFPPRSLFVRGDHLPASKTENFTNSLAVCYLV
ncbi:hypothetical protein YC2023_033065 [Brassica napus]